MSEAFDFFDADCIRYTSHNDRLFTYEILERNQCDENNVLDYALVPYAMMNQRYNETLTNTGTDDMTVMIEPEQLDLILVTALVIGACICFCIGWSCHEGVAK